MMSKKDYELLADAIVEAREPFLGDLGSIDTQKLYLIDLVVTVIASALQRDNPRFDYARKAGEPIKFE